MYSYLKYLVFVVLFSASTMYSQEGNRHDKIKALKTAYITEKLELSPADAENFWPIYNQFDKQLHDIRRNKRTEVYIVLRDKWNDLTDSEANVLMDKLISFQFQELQLMKERTEALRKIIAPKKVISLNKAEEDFKQELLDRYRKNKSEE